MLGSEWEMKKVAFDWNRTGDPPGTHPAAQRKSEETQNYHTMILRVNVDGSQPVEVDTPQEGYLEERRSDISTPVSRIFH